MNKKNTQELLYEIIFGAETKLGKLFDISLIVIIFASVFTLSLGTVKSIYSNYELFFDYAEWFFTIIFTIEYILRIIAAKNKRQYIFSFFGVIDLLSILPSYLALFLPSVQYIMVVRILRLLRIFRVLKLTKYISEMDVLILSFKNSWNKILILLYTIIMIAVIFGAILYIVEGSDSGFTSIPKSIYWAIVTLTTVGYGDIAPITPLGQVLSSVIMIMGYVIVAVPTGLYSAELIKQYSAKKNISNDSCENCSYIGHDLDAKYCKNCGNKF